MQVAVGHLLMKKIIRPLWIRALPMITRCAQRIALSPPPLLSKFRLQTINSDCAAVAKVLFNSTLMEFGKGSVNGILSKLLMELMALQQNVVSKLLMVLVQLLQGYCQFS